MLSSEEKIGDMHMQFLEEQILEITETTMAVNVGLGYSSTRPAGLHGS
jgi:hypothetical protein